MGISTKVFKLISCSSGKAKVRAGSLCGSVFCVRSQFDSSMIDTVEDRVSPFGSASFKKVFQRSSIRSIYLGRLLLNRALQHEIVLLPQIHDD
jgi:hypothetical protein